MLVTMINNKVRIISSKILYEGKWVKLRKDEIIKPDGTKATHEIAERNDCVIIIAVKNKKFTMVRSYRYAVDDKSWEFPTGFINKGEIPEKAAIRELEEETGLVAKNLKPLGLFWAWPGFLTSKAYVYYADSFSLGKTSLDETESDMEIAYFTQDQIKTMVTDGTIRSSATLATIGLSRLQNK